MADRPDLPTFARDARISAALLVADPSLEAGELAEDMVDETRRWEALRYDDGEGTSAPSVAAAFELSYRKLDDDAGRLFRLLPVNPGPDLSTQAAAALMGTSPREVRTVLSQLARAHLVEAAASAGRWRMHDLLRLYAERLSNEPVNADTRECARDRLLSFYAEVACAADLQVRGLPVSGKPAGFAGRATALAWLDAERPTLVAAVTLAANTGRNEIAFKLSLYMAEYLDWRRRFDDKLTITGIGLVAARHLGDKGNEAKMMNNLGIALRETGRVEEAITVHQNAANIFRAGFP